MFSPPQFRARRVAAQTLIRCLPYLSLLLPAMLPGQVQAARPDIDAIVMPTFGNRQYHLLSTPAQRVVATLRDSYELSHLHARQWLIYAPDAPDTDDQSAAFSTLNISDRECRASTWSELDPQASKLLSARLLDGYDNLADSDPSLHDQRFGQASLVTSATYTALLYRRELVPGAPSHAPAPLSPDARSLYTRSSETIDYDSTAFQAWLAATRLRRASGERDLDFALRAFRRIRAAYSYRYILAQDRRASSICRCTSADCGGLSQLFVAALRASGIPAVVLCGRIASSANTFTNGSAQGGSPGNVHVKSQFYAAGIGWVPVEMSGAVYDRTAPEQAYFGRSVGDFLTLSVGNDQQLSVGNGMVVNQRGFQGIRFWVWGVPSVGSSGTASGVTTRCTTDWSVRQLPIFTLGRQVAEAYP